MFDSVFESNISSYRVPGTTLIIVFRYRSWVSSSSRDAKL